MTHFLYSRYGQLDLGTLTEKLDKEYYQVLAALSRNAAKYVAALHQEDTESMLEAYKALCNELLAQMDHQLNIRRNVVLPYIKELEEKSASQHDCSTCSGKCHVGHAVHLAELKESHQSIKDKLYHMHKAALPLYANVDLPADYRKLRNELAMMETTLSELFYLEEANLIPGIVAAQKTINAFS